jgi:hypothetical protein
VNGFDGRASVGKESILCSSGHVYASAGFSCRNSEQLRTLTGRGFMTKRKARVIRALVVMLFGLPPLLNSLSNPRLAAAHGSDFVRLIAAGLCFGIGIGLLIGTLRFSGE